MSVIVFGAASSVMVAPFQLALRAVTVAIVVTAAGSQAHAQEPPSGPDTGAVVPALKAVVVVGLSDRAGGGLKAGDEANLAEVRDAKPTVYVLIKQWDRPTARLLRSLDESVATTAEGAARVAVWLSTDTPATREYLPRVQESLKLNHTALVCHDGTAPELWNINSDVGATVVITAGGKVTKTWGLVSVNDTLARGILKALSESAKPAAP